jgi:hypothetical protein
MLRIRAYRAINEPDTCEKFIEGHSQVLYNIGVKKVTSSKNDWMYNPHTFVIIVEHEDGRVMGGSRVDVAGGTQLLPIEEATGYLDSKIYNLVSQYSKNGGTGEICGLWNSREVAGLGIGSVFLTRASVIITEQIGIKSLFALCAPYTVKMAADIGYRIEKSIGNNGTFYYPKLDLLATSMILPDIRSLEFATELEKTSVYELRTKLVQQRVEQIKSKQVSLNYDLSIAGIKDWQTYFEAI